MKTQQQASTASELVPVTVDNFNRAESDLVFGGMVKTRRSSRD
jgi:hypothetical protein